MKRARKLTALFMTLILTFALFVPVSAKEIDVYAHEHDDECYHALSVFTYDLDVYEYDLDEVADEYGELESRNASCNILGHSPGAWQNYGSASWYGCEFVQGQVRTCTRQTCNTITDWRYNSTWAHVWQWVGNFRQCKVCGGVPLSMEIDS